MSTFLGVYLKKTPIKENILNDLKKVKKHLESSYTKVLKLKLSKELDDNSLETFESFSSRFARFSDILISKYLRLLAMEADPAYRGSVVDLLNFSEKNGWISSSQEFKKIRELRNTASHDYSAENINDLYAELIKSTPALLAVKFDAP